MVEITYKATEVAFWIVAAVILVYVLFQSTSLTLGITLVLILRALLLGERIERHLRQL